jgi:hypothetical protein
MEVNLDFEIAGAIEIGNQAGVNWLPSETFLRD